MIILRAAFFISLVQTADSEQSDGLVTKGDMFKVFDFEILDILGFLTLESSSTFLNIQGF